MGLLAAALPAVGGRGRGGHGRLRAAWPRPWARRTPARRPWRTRGRLRQPSEVPLRDGQPRDDELVLHGDDLRHPGRVRHHRLLVPVDRLDELDRRPDGLGVQQRHRRQGERHRVLPDRQHRRSTPRSTTR